MYDCGPLDTLTCLGFPEATLPTPVKTGTPRRLGSVRVRPASADRVATSSTRQDYEVHLRSKNRAGHLWYFSPPGHTP